MKKIVRKAIVNLAESAIIVLLCVACMCVCDPLLLILLSITTATWNWFVKGSILISLIFLVASILVLLKDKPIIT